MNTVLHNFVSGLEMYGNGLHDDLDKPSNAPAITGQPTKKKEAKYKPLTEALAAATAIMKVLVARSNASPSAVQVQTPKRQLELLNRGYAADITPLPVTILSGRSQAMGKSQRRSDMVELY